MAPHRRRRLTDFELDRLVERDQELKRLRLVAAEFDIDRSTARAHLRARGITLLHLGRGIGSTNREQRGATTQEHLRGRPLTVCPTPAVNTGRITQAHHAHSTIRAIASLAI